MLNQIIAVFFIAFFVATSALFFCVALVIWLFTVLFDNRLVLLHLFSSFWASVYLWAMPAWSVRVEGRSTIRMRDRYVIVSNHLSQLDILMAFRLFFPFKWVSKAEVFRIPFIGWNMYLNRYIKLKRGDKKGIAKMFVDCEQALAEGNSLFCLSRRHAVRNRKPETVQVGGIHSGQEDVGSHCSRRYQRHKGRSAQA